MALSIEELRKVMSSARRIIEVDCPGIGTVALRQLDCTVGMKLASIAQQVGSDADNSIVVGEKMTEFYVELLAASIVDENGNTGFDTPDGRAMLRHLRIDQLTSIGNAAIELNGMGTTQKN